VIVALLANRDFRMTSYDSEDYDDIIRQQRETDFQVVGEDAFDDDGISDMRTKQLEGDQAKCRKERLNQTFSSVTDQHIMDEVQSMSPESIDIFFGYLDIYKLLEIAYSEFLSDMTSEYERKTELCLN
jgi:hypothetical protein